MFESSGTENAATRLRGAALPPLLAFLIALVSRDLAPFFGRLAPLLYRAVTLLLFAGGVIGAVAIVRALLRERPRGLAWIWLAGAIAVEYLCVSMFLALT